MRTPLAVSSAALLAVACATSSTPPPSKPAPVEVKSTGTPGQAAAVRTQKVSATVKAVDKAARTITLQDKTGATATAKVGPEVRRFDEIAPGDTVQVEVEQGLLLEYQPVGSESVPMHAAAAGARATSSQAPAGVVAAGVQGTVTITAIDTKSRMVTIQDSLGETYQVKAGPGLQIEKLKTGDRLLATYVETIAIQLEKAGSKP